MPDSSLRFRVSEDRAVKAFRPILRKLHLRERVTEQQPVFLAGFPALDLLDLDYWSIRVVPTPLVQHGAYGMFALRFLPNDNKRVEAFLFIEKSLYDRLDKDGDDKQLALLWIKHIGVHEFVHFLACIYAVTTVSFDAARKQMLKRFEERVRDRLDEKTMKELIKCLKSDDPSLYLNNTSFNDAHFCIKGITSVPENRLDYAKLFLKLLFSRELFEDCFLTGEKKHEIMSIRSKAERENQIRLGAVDVAKEKSVLETTALHNLKDWINEYLIGNNENKGSYH
jgi:hypothetical protein